MCNDSLVEGLVTREETTANFLFGCVEDCSLLCTATAVSRDVLMGNAPRMEFGKTGTLAGAFFCTFFLAL